MHSREKKAANCWYSYCKEWRAQRHLLWCVAHEERGRCCTASTALVCTTALPKSSLCGYVDTILFQHIRLKKTFSARNGKSAVKAAATTKRLESLSCGRLCSTAHPYCRHPPVAPCPPLKPWSRQSRSHTTGGPFSGGTAVPAENNGSTNQCHSPPFGRKPKSECECAVQRQSFIHSKRLLTRGDHAVTTRML